MKNKIISFVIMTGFVFFIGGDLVGMEGETVPVISITSIPYVIKKSGSYRLSPDAIDKGGTRKKFGAAIKIYNNVDVALDLQGAILDAHGRHFAIDANFAHSLYLSNGIITGATIGIGGLYSYVVLDNVTIENCKISTELKNYEIK